MIKLIKKSEIKYIVIINNISIGAFEMDVDGYFYFWLDDRSYGSFSSHSLIIIADELDKINKPYDDKVKIDLMKI